MKSNKADETRPDVSGIGLDVLGFSRARDPDLAAYVELRVPKRTTCQHCFGRKCKGECK